MEFTQGGISPANIGGDNSMGNRGSDGVSSSMGNSFEGTQPHSHVDTEVAALLHEGEAIDVSIVVNRPAAEIYNFWRDFRNLPRFMSHLGGIEIISDTRSRWHWRTLGGFQFAWDSEIIEDVPDRVIAWQTTADSQVHNAGAVRFRSLGFDELSGQTEVQMRIRYTVPGGRLAEGIAHIFGEAPDQVLATDLERLKMILEGENS